MSAGQPSSSHHRHPHPAPALTLDDLRAAKEAALHLAKRAARAAADDASDAAAARHLDKDGLRAVTRVIYEGVKAGRVALDAVLEAAACGGGAGGGAERDDGGAMGGPAAEIAAVAYAEARRLIADG